MRVCEKDRYHSNRMIMRSTGRPPFDAEFIVADCCQVKMHVCVQYCIHAATNVDKIIAIIYGKFDEIFS